MSEQRRPGKLAVILHADIAGSTTLVQQDEHLAHQRIQTTFRRFSETIVAYHGRVRELRGDALLAEFDRASDAVTAALVFQADQTEHNPQVDDGIRPTVRIGIAMGEILIADRTLTGAGVVLAQRVEQLAKPGGVCISAAVHESLPQRMPFYQEGLGEQEVKGFNEPVRVYGVRLRDGVEPPRPAEIPKDRKASASRWMAVAVFLLTGIGLLTWFKSWAPSMQSGAPERSALPLPDKPSVVVLPFHNLSPEGSESYLADAITETLIATLGQVPELFVIARNSAFTYKGKPVDVRKVGRELGVRHVLEGSLQQTGDRVRVTAQLIDATTGEHLWAERYDQPLDDIFALQDEIALKVLVSLQGELTEGADAALRSSSTEDIQAYLRFQQALNVYFTFTKDAMLESRRLANEALELDPDFATPRLLKAWTHIVDALYGYSASSEASLAEAEAELERLESLDDRAMTSTIVEGEVSMVRAYIALMQRRYDLALAYGEKTAVLVPNHADMLASYGSILLRAGEPGQAVELFKRAMRLSPHYESWQAALLSTALVLSGNHEAAVAAAKDAIDRAESDFTRAQGHMRLAIAYADQDMLDRANKEAERARELVPFMTVEWFRATYYLYRNNTDLERLAGALRAAGLPE